MPKTTPELWAEIRQKTNITLQGGFASRPFDMKDGAVIEGPCLLTSPPNLLYSFGAYSILRDAGAARFLSIGRFTSIGPRLYSCAPEHNMYGVSTSSIFINDYDWARPVDKPLPPPLNIERAGFDIPRTVIGNDVWIGRNVYLRSGISIGDGAVIGAHSVVTRNVAPYTIVAGNPAKVIRARFAPELAQRLQAIRWWDYDPEWIAKVDIRDTEGVASFFEREGNSLPPFNPARVIFTDEIDIRGQL